MPPASDVQPIAFRPATPNDCPHLVLLADMATRRLTSLLWGQAASAGQSAFEIGRDIIRNDQSHFTHFSNWRVAEGQGQVVGAVGGYVIPESSGAPAAGMDIVKPLNELKAMAAGTWYISAVAVYPEYQGEGFGKSLLMEAESMARAAGKDRLTLMVGSFNARAYGLYRAAGFAAWDRRPFVPFPGSDEAGEWILMGKDLPRES
ncbi:GNAT family N-acetyltransferase [Pleomorphomonas sp. PLEO]|uniref:GNAT family N-acetyltransferase n=1 Tax=Pleomorphomonas sp. PLEO TaxID=3239306 RepID=UPI00351E8DB9